MSFNNIVEELNRVPKKYIVIYDHIKSDNIFKKKIQEFYWKYFDGGEQYLTNIEWEKILINYNVIKRIQCGAIGTHVIKIILQKK